MSPQIAQSKTVVQKIVHQKRCFVQKIRSRPRQPVVLQRVHSTISSFNKSQQDAFLPFVEAGLFTFIGATTENPSFEVNAALLSRAQVYVLKPLTDADLEALFVRAHAAGVLEGLELDAAARAVLVGYADGDARRFLNLLEQTRTAARAQQVQHVDTAFLENVLTLNARRFDKGGDAFYDQISALHKSVRGSHPDAALY